MKNAQAVLGIGWDHVSNDIRWGLVCSHIVAMCIAQDESIPAENVRRMLIEVEAAALKLIFG